MPSLSSHLPLCFFFLLPAMQQKQLLLNSQEVVSVLYEPWASYLESHLLAPYLLSTDYTFTNPPQLQSWNAADFTSSCRDINKNCLKQPSLINHLHGGSETFIPPCSVQPHSRIIADADHGSSPSLPLL